MMFVTAFALPACGRVGVHLLPKPAGESDAAVSDSGMRADADSAAPSCSNGDSGTGADAMNRDAGVCEGSGGGVEAGLEAGVSVDSGVTDDASVIQDSGAPDACPTVCDNPNGAASCDTGVCVSSCATGYSDCDRDPTNGCETHVGSDAMNCGSCATACTNDHGTAACGGGLCTPTCQAGYSDCDAIAENGCEASLSSVTDCGACGVACLNPHGTTSCVSGLCSPACAAGYADCDGDPKNGCEANTNTDPTHCGSCMNACPTSGVICTAGTCQADTCPTGFAECDGNLAVACETDTTSSVSNCSFCGNGCTTANGTPRCTSSTCQVQSCNTNYANCDNAPGNGCEVNLRTNTTHCGACGTSCVNAHGTTSCAASVCAPSCSTGWGDCDTSRPNGCETALNTTSNCGTCGRTCAGATGGTPICSAGLCSVACDLTGTWALKIVAPSTWSNATYIRGGSGNHVLWLRMTATQSGNSVSESMIECGRSVPDFEASMVNETYNFALMTSLFDHAPPYLPASTATLTLSNQSPGATISQPLTAFLMGTTMSNPTTATWPNAASGLTQVDMDGDGDPGVRLTYLGTGGYSHPRTAGTLGAARAVYPYVASRVVFSLQGTLSSCTQASGPATVTHVDVRIFGCELESGSNCNGSQANFLDSNCVKYTIGSSTYQMVKVANGASCAAVRSALP